MERHQHKVVLVTGSTHGIGKAIILELAKLNFSVVINGASTNHLSNEYQMALESIFEGNYEERTLFSQADISNNEDRRKVIEDIQKKFNRIDVLVNNAGVAPHTRNDILESTEDSYDRVMNINLKGPYFLTRDIANWMIELKNQIQDYQPYIINISSISRYTSSPTRGEYCLSKAGISMMTKLFADRLAEYYIPVYEISPGIIETKMTDAVHEKYEKLIRQGLTPLRRWGKPIDVAKSIVAIVSGLLPYATGCVIDIDGGFHLHRL
ncbi:MAG: 3-ketoacyl-ACP reductase [Promethearchaeota archaeon]|nr:MAG: 3-ketoacyl-ACP reductase [Candidatus Lokiarchaeota archaeon]